MLVFKRKFTSELNSIVKFLTDFKENYLERLTDNPQLRDRMEYAVMEAVDNAHEHGNRKDPEKYIVVCCWKAVEFLVFSVLDEGAGFDGKIPGIRPGLKNLNGRGLISIQDYAHSVSFNDKGNLITFTFRTW